MAADSGLLQFLTSYWGFSFAVATGFYGGMVWFGRNHLLEEYKDNLSLWMWGEYESTWSEQFCNMFDAVFGSQHLSWRCFLRSSVASVLSVILLYTMLAKILNVMNGRALPEQGIGDLNLWKVVLIGAAINIFPDYLSLLETRWLIKHFEKVHSITGQLAVLFVDAIFTGSIIWLGINVFQFLRGADVLSAVEMLALFSVFSLFFYSTFLTSVWVWLYCLSTSLMRLFSRTPLRNILPLGTKPVEQIALMGASMILVVGLILMPFLKTDKTNRMSRIDNMLCSVFQGDMCLHLIRVTEDLQLARESMELVCGKTVDANCYVAVKAYFKDNENVSNSLWQKSCEGGYLPSCQMLGWIFFNGIDVEKDSVKGVSYFKRTCDAGIVEECRNLGIAYNSGQGVVQDRPFAVSLFRHACDRGSATGCRELGAAYNIGAGVVRDSAMAVSLFEKACYAGLADACSDLGSMYNYGLGVRQDNAMADLWYQVACEGGSAIGCYNLEVE